MGSIAIAGGSSGRTILTANTNYYVAIGGSDSNSGLSPATAWATLQHAGDFLAKNIDIGGFEILVSVGAGTFAGVGLRSFVGGGNVRFAGASRTTTTITAGPNDGTFNTGECFSVFFPLNTTLLIDLFTLVGPSTAYTVSFDGPNLIAFGANTVQGDLGFSLANSPIACVGNFNLGGALVQGANLTITANGGSTINFYDNESTGTIHDFVNFLTLVGTPNFTQSFYFGATGSAYFVNPSAVTVTGTATGVRAILASDASAWSVNGTGTLGPHFFPGNSDIQVDSSASYDGFLGPYPGVNTQTGTPYVLAITDALNVVEMNLAGANQVTVPANATVPFLIGTKIWVTQIGAGATTIAGAVGVTVDNAGVVGGQWKSVKLYKRGTDEWVQTNA